MDNEGRVETDCSLQDEQLDRHEKLLNEAIKSLAMSIKHNEMLEEKLSELEQEIDDLKKQL
jgi:hypothetical protein